MQKKSIQDVIREMKKSTCSSSSDETDNSSDESGDEQNVCFNCKSKYPPTKKRIKSIDWVQCDEFDRWYHEFCVSRDESTDQFICIDCF